MMGAASFVLVKQMKRQDFDVALYLFELTGTVVWLTDPLPTAAPGVLHHKHAVGRGLSLEKGLGRG